MKVVYSAAADRDLEDIGDWIADDSPQLAVAFVERMRGLCAAIGDFPRAYAVVRRFGDVELRRRVAGAYIIFYRISDFVEIVRVLHGARDQDLIFDPDEE